MSLFYSLGLVAGDRVDGIQESALAHKAGQIFFDEEASCLLHERLSHVHV